MRRSGEVSFLGSGPSHVSEPNYGGSGYVSSARVCGSTWPYRDYLQAWIDPRSVAVVSPSPATWAYDPTDVNAAGPTPLLHRHQWLRPLNDVAALRASRRREASTGRLGVA